MRDLCAEAQTLFELFVSVQTLSLADVYGGKLCAALDRQHPRDLYDVRLLLANEGLTPQVRRAFVVYLASHDRPMHRAHEGQDHLVGPLEAGEVPAPVRDIGLAALNRWYRYAWQCYPHRDIRIANAVIAAAAGAGAVDLPAAMDAVRSVRVAGGALLPLSEVRDADFAAVYADAPGTPVAYVQLVDGATADIPPVPFCRIRLAPLPVAPLTLHVNGLKRFVPLDWPSPLLLPKVEAALFYFVLAELFGFAKDAVQQKAAHALAKEHFNNALAYETGGDACDDVSLPLQKDYNARAGAALWRRKTLNSQRPFR